MEKTTIEYIKQKNKELEKKTEIKNELIKKIKYFRWKIRKDVIINRISEEFKNNFVEENIWNVFSEIINQNNENKQRKEKLMAQLMKIKSEIQREKRKYSMLKKILIKEDFSWVDEYSINKRKKKRDETKSKIEHFNRILDTLEEKKVDIEKEISGIEVVESKKRLYNTRKSLEHKDTNYNENNKYKKYTIEELLKYDIWLSKELKNYILNEIKIESSTKCHSKKNKWNINMFTVIICVFILGAMLSWFLDPYVIQIILWWILWLFILIYLKKSLKCDYFTIFLFIIAIVWLFIFTSFFNQKH